MISCDEVGEVGNFDDEPPYESVHQSVPPAGTGEGRRISREMRVKELEAARRWAKYNVMHIYAFSKCEV